VAFQKFLMEFSVRPGSRFVILLQWLPTSAWHCASRNSSSGDQLPLQAAAAAAAVAAAAACVVSVSRSCGNACWSGCRKYQPDYMFTATKKRLNTYKRGSARLRCAGTAQDGGWNAWQRSQPC
jgi:hypothetical protein